MKLIQRLQNFIHKISEDDIFTLSAALSYFAALAIAPIIIILMSFLSFLNKDLQFELKYQTLKIVGEDAKNVLETIINSTTNRPDLSVIAGWVGLVLLSVSGSVVFAQIHSTLNKIFVLKTEDEKIISVKHKILDVISRRLFSILTLFSFILFSIVSLILSTVLLRTLNIANDLSFELLMSAANTIIFALLFTVLFKWMPDRHIMFRDSFKAGIVTAILFLLGKRFITLYLAQFAIGSAYGAAGSFVALLIWIYYSAFIFYFGAEFLENFLVKAKAKE